MRTRMIVLALGQVRSGWSVDECVRLAVRLQASILLRQCEETIAGYACGWSGQSGWSAMIVTEWFVCTAALNYSDFRAESRRSVSSEILASI